MDIANAFQRLVQNAILETQELNHKCEIVETDLKVRKNEKIIRCYYQFGYVNAKHIQERLQTHLLKEGETFIVIFWNCGVVLEFNAQLETQQLMYLRKELVKIFDSYYFHFPLPNSWFPTER